MLVQCFVCLLWSFFAAERLRLQEQLFRMRSVRKESQMRREYLLSQAKVLQARATKYKEKVRIFHKYQCGDLCPYESM